MSVTVSIKKPSNIVFLIHSRTTMELTISTIKTMTWLEMKVLTKYRPLLISKLQRSPNIFHQYILLVTRAFLPEEQNGYIFMMKRAYFREKALGLISLQNIAEMEPQGITSHGPVIGLLTFISRNFYFSRHRNKV